MGAKCFIYVKDGNSIMRVLQSAISSPGLLKTKLVRAFLMGWFLATIEIGRFNAQTCQILHCRLHSHLCYMQDIVTASPEFDVDAFIPQLRDFLTVQDVKQSMFLIQWITLLAGVPDVDLLSHLPQLLGGLLDAMTINNREVTDAAGRALEVCLSLPHTQQMLELFAMKVLQRRLPGRNQ